MPLNYPQESELVQNFFTSPPGWILRSGMGVLFMLAVVGLIMTWFIRYPDRLDATVTVRTQQAPVDITASGSGQIDTLLAEDLSPVRQGQALCLIQNAASLLDVEKLERLISLERPISLEEYHSFKLGNIQPLFATWLQAKDNLNEFTRQTYAIDQIRTLEKEVASVHDLMQEMQKRKALVKEELDLATSEYERNRRLHAREVISDQELEFQKTKWLQARRYAQSLEEEEIQNQIRQEQLRSQQIKIRAEHQIGIEERIRNLQQATLQLKGAISQWRQEYLLTAPIEGLLSWKTGLSKGLYLSNGTSPGTIIPVQRQGLIAICTIPTAGAGRVRPGNKVLIDLDAFPPEEFGRLEGKVAFVARLPDSGEEGKLFYQVEAALPDTLHTSYDKIIPFRQNLTGTARIFTRERRLFERLFGTILERF